MNLTFLRNKNFKLLFAFLLIILVITPEVAQGNFLEVCTPQQWLTFPMTTFQCALAWMFTALLKLVLIIIAVVAWIPVFFFSIILVILTNLLSSSLGPLLSVPVLGSQLVVDMWSFVRDFANLFFILFFVLIGLSTILKIESYKFQKTLPLLIVMALLVNFSLVFVGLVVDIGNILTSIFLGAVEGKALMLNNFSSIFQNTFTEGISTIWNASWANWGMNVITAFVGIIAYYLGILFVYITIVLVLFVIIFIFIWRIAILWILAILSPLAFVSYIFETTRKAIWQRWLSALVKWSIVAVPILFFMFIGFYILHNSPAEIQQITQGLPTGPDGVGQMSRLIQVTIIPLLSVLIMFIGVIVSMTVLPEAAESAISLAKQSPSLASGAINAIGKKSPFVSKVQSGFMKRMESAGFMKSGTFSQKLAGEKKEVSDRVKEMSAKDLTNALEKWNITAPEIAAIMEKLAGEGKLTPGLIRDYGNKALLGGAEEKVLYGSIPTIAPSRDTFEKIKSKITSADSWKGVNIEETFKATTNSEEESRQLELLERFTDMSEKNIREATHSLTSKDKKILFDAMNGTNGSNYEKLSQKIKAKHGDLKRLDSAMVHLYDFS